MVEALTRDHAVELITDTAALHIRLGRYKGLNNTRVAGELDWPEGLEDTQFKNCVIEAADLSGVDFEGATFEDCAFRGTSFRSARLRSSRFTDCRFYIDDLVVDFRYAELREASFERCDLSMACFQRAGAYGLRLQACQAQGADFSQADFSLAMTRKKTLVSLECEDCNLAYADFSNTNLAGVTLRGCRLIHGLFQYCDMRDADLRDSDLTNLDANQLSLKGVDLRGATFNNLDPRVIDMGDARVDPEQAQALLGAMDIEVCLPD